jgi:8-hydroxy-5-deazaflavin:NADPH oxidoreductase
LRGKIPIDFANPLEMSQGMPPSLTVCNTDSLGEQMQREFPDMWVVKALNTMHGAVMVQPSLVPGEHHVFLCGNDAAAKGAVTAWRCEWFGWPQAHIMDLGDITAARGMETFLPLWLRLWSAVGTPHFNSRVVRGS